jgi:serine/threonine-protein kinase RsbW
MSSSSDKVTITLPCRPEYVGVVRLALLGVASRLPFSYDEVEDLRLAVGEACTYAVERAGDLKATLTVTICLDEHGLEIEVIDDVPQDTPKKISAQDSDLLAETGIDQEGLGALLMEILVDKLDIVPGPTGTTVHLTKYAPKQST